MGLKANGLLPEIQRHPFALCLLFIPPQDPSDSSAITFGVLWHLLAIWHPISGAIALVRFIGTVESLMGAPCEHMARRSSSLNEAVQLCMMRYDGLHRLRLLSICIYYRLRDIDTINNGICSMQHMSKDSHES